MRHLPLAVIAAIALTVCAEAQDSGRRIQEAAFQRIGEIEQWITIRGDDDRRPVLLLLHGGPGDVQSPFVSTYAPYERSFVLVQWDQRGAGRTFAKNEVAGVSLDRLVADGLELTQRLRMRFPGQKMIVLGHSWGTIIATAMALERPDLLDAYVGTGQVSAWADTVQFQFDYLKAQYRAAGDAKGLAALEAIGKPDPKNVGQYFSFSRPIRQFLNASDVAWLAGVRQAAIAQGETDETIKTTGDGMNASGAALIGATVSTDLPVTAPRVAVPYYLIQGRHDVFAPTSLAEAYFAKLSAPAKQMVVIEDAGHFALATHATAFVAELEKMVR